MKIKIGFLCALMLSVSQAQAAVSVLASVNLAGVQFDTAGGSVNYMFTNRWAAIYGLTEFITSPDFDVVVTTPQSQVRAQASPELLRTSMTGTPPTYSLAAYTLTRMDLSYSNSPLSISIPYSYSMTRQSLDEFVLIDLFAQEGWMTSLYGQSIQFEGEELHREGSGWINITLDPYYHGRAITSFEIANYTYAWVTVPTPVPEPETWALLGAGAGAVFAARRRGSKGRVTTAAWALLQ